MKFKVGDRVKVVKMIEMEDGESNKPVALTLGEVGTVVDIRDLSTISFEEDFFEIQWDIPATSYEYKPIAMFESELEKV